MQITKRVIKSLLLGLVLISLAVPAEDPAHYVKEGTWQETMRVSRDALLQREQAGELGTSLPDLGGADFTIMAWIKTTSETGTIFVKTLTRGRLPNVTQRMAGFNPRFSGLQQSQSKALYIKDGTLVYEISSVGAFDSEAPVNDGQWHHVTLAGKDPLEFYVDGIPAKSGRIGDPGDIEPDLPEHVFSLGTGSRIFLGGTFNGDMDEVRFYNRKLSAGEVQAVYENAKDVSEGLAGWWQFEEQASDASGNDYHGSISRTQSTEGKIGKGLRFARRSSVQLPPPKGVTASLELWDLVSRDFPDDQARKEMEREQQDNVWNSGWKAGDLKELAGRYSGATRDFGGLPKKAGKLVRGVNNAAGLQKVRDVYHLSITNHETYTDLSAKVKTLRPAIAYLTEQYAQTYPKGRKHLDRLKAFEKRLARLEKRPADLKTLERLKDDFQQLEYEALVADNPLIDFDQLLFVKRYTYQSSHYYTDFIDGTENPGGNLSILSLKDGTVTEILPSMKQGIFGRYDLSFDGKRVVFDWKRAVGEGFRIYETGLDSKGLRQLTSPPPDEPERIKKYDNSYSGGTSRVYQHHTDDMHPCYLPDGGIVFTSSRCEYGTLCDGPDKLTTAVLYRMDGDGQNMEKLTDSAVSEFAPSVMNDGRILYSRWEYVDKGQLGVKCIWAMRPDGSGTVEIFGNDIALPPVFTLPRAIPGYNNLFVVLGTPHYPQSGVGTVIRLDINQPIRTRKPMTYITPDVDIRAEPGFDHMVDGQWVRTQNGPIYMDPYPLSDKFFLVSHNPDKRWNEMRAYGLYLLDEFGNKVLIYKDPEFSCWEPMPLRSRPKPPVIPTTRPPQDKQAIVVLSDVYVGLNGVERGTIKYLRIMEQVPRPWDSRRFWEINGGAPRLSLGSVLALKVLHGIVPVYEDGSAHFIVPTDKNIYFQALDENFMEVQRQRTYINYRPGERRACIGCHEYRQLAPANKTILALRHPPSTPEAQPGDKAAARPLHYPTDVQPTLDKHCVSCHSGAQPKADLDLSGEMTDSFTRSYESIIRRGLVKTFNEGSDWDGTEAVPPFSVGSHASKLITVIREGHNGVKLSQEEFIKLVTWVDANAQYYGSYYGRQSLVYKDHPNFRPLPTFEEAISSRNPREEENRQGSAGWEAQMTEERQRDDE